MELIFADMSNLKAKLILISSILPALLGFLAATTTPAVACYPDDSSDSLCLHWGIRASSSAPTLAPTATSTPRGDSPNHALDITGNWTTIEPGASVWYRTPNSDGYRDIELWIDSPAQNALSLSLFSPDQQIGSWADWKPVGRGTFNKGQPEHALTWIAAYARSGVWYALVQNFSAAPVSYKLDGNVSSTDTKTCHGYWENLRGAMIYWIDCNPLHNPQ